MKKKLLSNINIEENVGLYKSDHSSFSFKVNIENIHVNRF